ncbi:MAG: tandem-95 repeat protein, partial [Balneolaceae bacterium]
LNAALTVTQSMTWNTNALVTGPQTSVLTIPEGSQLLMNAGSRSVGGAFTLNLEGTTLWSAGNIGQNQATAVVINNSGVFEMAGDLTLGTFNAFWGTFNNTGIFRKSAGAGNGLIESSIRLVNSGTLEVASGTLQLRMGNPTETTLHGGTIVLADTTTLAFIGGNHRLPESGVISGPEGGPVRARITLSNASLTLDAPLELVNPFTTENAVLTLNRDYSFPDLILNNTTLTLNAALTVTQSMTWNTNALVTGPQTSVLTIPEGSQLLMNAGSRSVGGAFTLNLEGTTLWSAGNIGQNQATAVVINNSGVFEMAGDLTLGTFNAFWGTFNNTGIFRKSAGAGNGLIESSIRLVNSGTLEVASGTLQLRMGNFNATETLEYTGTFLIGGESTLAIIGGNHRLAESGNITGSGTLALSGGTFRNDGSISPGLPTGILNVAGNLPFSSESARLEIGLGGDQPGTDQDQLVVSGTANLDGTLSLQLLDGFLPQPEQEFLVLRAGDISGVFTGISQPDLGSDRSFVAIYSDSTVSVRFSGAQFTRPIAVDDSTSTPFNTAVTINVLANDISTNGDPLTIVAVTQPQNGTTEISGDSLITYTPASGFSGTDHFTYVISNSLEEADTARVTVTVLEEVIINNPPVAVNDTASTVLNLPVLVNVLANDSDPDGDPVSVLGFENPSNEGGSVVLTPDDRLQYTPPDGFTGTDRFRYSITDGRGGVDTALVVIEVFPVRFEVVLAGSPGTRALAVDEDGTVAGNRIAAGSPVQGFYMNSGTEVFLNAGPSGSQVYGISAGVMTGIVMVNDTSGTAHLFSSDGATTELGTLGGTFSLGYAINATGQVTGVSTDSAGRSRAFITGENGGMTNLSTPGFQFSTGYAVNRDGVVAGMVSNPGGVQRAWISGQVKAEPNSRAYSINTAGDAAGSLESQGEIRAAYWTAGGETVVLPSGNQPFAEAYSINDAGWVTGAAGPNPPGFNSGSSISAVPGGLPRSMAAPNESIATIPEQHRAVVWISDTLFDLNDLIDPTSGWTLLEAAAINSSGQIAGTGIHQGALRAFLLSPVDEEPPLALDVFEVTSAGTELIIELGSLNGPGVRVVQVSRPEHGSASIEGETTIRYTPIAGQPGSDRFRYTLSNGRSVSHGHITVTIESAPELPERMMLGQNYPNPFNPGTVIPVYLPATTEVRLEVFDLLGRFVLDVFNGTLDAGEHHLTVDAARLSSGTYIYRLSSSAGIQTRKMTLLK